MTTSLSIPLIIRTYLKDLLNRSYPGEEATRWRIRGPDRLVSSTRLQCMVWSAQRSPSSINPTWAPKSRQNNSLLQVLGFGPLFYLLLGVQVGYQESCKSDRCLNLQQGLRAAGVASVWSLSACRLRILEHRPLAIGQCHLDVLRSSDGCWKPPEIRGQGVSNMKNIWEFPKRQDPYNKDPKLRYP